MLFCRHHSDLRCWWPSSCFLQTLWVSGCELRVSSSRARSITPLPSLASPTPSLSHGFFFSPSHHWTSVIKGQGEPGSSWKRKGHVVPAAFPPFSFTPILAVRRWCPNVALLRMPTASFLAVFRKKRNYTRTPLSCHFVTTADLIRNLYKRGAWHLHPYLNLFVLTLVLKMKKCVKINLACYLREFTISIFSGNNFPVFSCEKQPAPCW